MAPANLVLGNPISLMIFAPLDLKKEFSLIPKKKRRDND
jgi:hypothetical protein